MTTSDSIAGVMAEAGARPDRNADRMLAELRRRMFRTTSAGEGFARYRELECIGQGGMGVVYRAWDPELRRTVAIKVLRADRAQEAARLVREARAMAAVSDPHVVQVLDVGVHDGELFVVMEYVAGSDAAHWVAAAPRSWRAVLDVFVAAGRGLAAAHARGLVHRDFKPSNVLIGGDGRVCVTDFGLASAHAASVSDHGDRRRDESTSTHGRVGTPRYMAPEQHDSGSVDARADQFAFAVSLWESLWGEHPVDAQAPARTPAIGSPPRRIRTALRRALASDPADRHATMLDLLAALRLRGSPRRIVAAAVLVVPIALFGLREAGGDPPRCADAAAAVHAEWNDAIRRELSGGFTAAAPYGDVAWAEFSRGVDDWTTRWSDAATAACSSADAPMRACLDRQLGELAALVRIFAEPDADTVARAGAAAGQLPVVGACTDGEEPLDAEGLAALARHEAWMADVRARARVGRWADAASLAEDALQAALAAGLRTAAIEAGIELGLGKSRQGDPDGAATALQAAFFAATEDRHAELAVRACAAMITIDAARGRLVQAEDWIRHAQSWQARASVGVPVRIELALATADLENERNRPAAALAQLERAWELCGRDEAAPWAPRIWNAMGLAHIVAEDFTAAESVLGRAVEIGRVHLGEMHPQHAHAVGNLGTAYFQQGRYDLAEAAYLEAHRIRQATAPDTLAAVTMEMNVALAANARGHVARSLELLQGCERTANRVLGPDHPQTALLVENIGNTLMQLGEIERASAVYARVLEVRREIYGPDHPSVASVLVAIADTSLALQRRREAVAGYREAIAVLERVGRADHSDAAAAWRAMALALDELDETAAAREAAEKGERIAVRTFGADHPILADHAVTRAQIALHQDRWDDAIRAAERARTLEAENPVRRGLAAFYLAQGLWRRDGARARSRVAELVGVARDELARGEGRLGVAMNAAMLQRWADRNGFEL